MADLLPFLGVLLGVGAFAGLIAGLFGIGGGVVIVPALYAMLGALDLAPESRMHIAVGTSLATIIATSLRSVAAHHTRGSVDFAVIRSWAPWIVLGALLGSQLAAATTGRVLTIVFALTAFLVAIRMAFLSGKDAKLASDLPTGPARVGLGGGIGVLSSLMGIGGGVFGVMLMTLCGRTIHQAVGTAAGFGVAIGVPGALGYIIGGWNAPDLPWGSLGYLSLPGFAIITAMTVTFAPLGARLAHALPQKHLKRLFAVGLTLVAAHMLYDAVRPTASDAVFMGTTGSTSMSR